jgi:hypothetical protein
MRTYLRHLTTRTDVMMAAELYQKTLAGSEASLGKGESVSLSRYCKIHHVNNRGLRYWMKKHSIHAPKGKSGKAATFCGFHDTGKAVTGSGYMVPLLIQEPNPIAGLEKNPINRTKEKRKSYVRVSRRR